MNPNSPLLNGPQAPPPPPPSGGSFGSRAWAYLIIGAIAAAGLAISIYSLVNGNGKSDFFLRTNTESMFMEGDPPIFDSTYVSGCTNKSIGTLSRDFRKGTYVATTCPETLSVCTDYMCRFDGVCVETLLENNTCATNSDCMGLQICQECNCVDPGDSNSTLACVLDSDCTNFNETSSCVESFCDLMTARCATRFVDPLFDCDGSCPVGQSCQDCVCIDFPTSTGCLEDSDCLNITSTSDCRESFCDLATLTCDTRFVDPGFDCDGSCPTGESCQDCVCTPVGGGGGCTVDTDCLDFNATSQCVEAICSSGRCTTQYTVMGGDCSSNADCGAGEVCNGCICGVPEGCSGTGYDIEIVSPPDGFTCGLDVGIDDMVIISVCYETAVIAETPLSLVSWVKTGSSWVQADLVNTTLFLQSQAFPAQPAMDMDNGRLIVYGNSDVSPFSNSRQVEFWDYDQNGIFTFNTLITPLTVDTAFYVPGGSTEIVGSVCIGGDFALIADVVIGDNSMNSTIGLSATPWFLFDGSQWISQNRQLFFNDAQYNSFTSCQIRSDGLGIINIATPINPADPLYREFAQYYRFFQLTPPLTGIINTEVYGISNPTNLNNVPSSVYNPIFEGVIIDPQFGDFGTFPVISATVFASFTINGIDRPDEIIVPFLLPANYNKELNILWGGQSTGFVYPGLRNTIDTFGTNMLAGNALFSGPNLSGATVIDFVGPVQMTGFDDPFFISVGLYEDQPVWGVRNGMLNSTFLYDYTILANTCP